MNIEESHENSEFSGVWDSYLAFENFFRPKGMKLDDFVSKWKEKKSLAETAGCQYTDVVLACKLLQKANLEQDDVVSIVSSIHQSGGEVFPIIVSKLEFRSNDHYYDIDDLDDFPVSTKKEYSEDSNYPMESGTTSPKLGSGSRCIRCNTAFSTDSKGYVDTNEKGLLCHLCCDIDDSSHMSKSGYQERYVPEETMLIKVEPTIDESMDEILPWQPTIKKEKCKEKFHKCPLCEVEFNRPSKLKIHVEKKHPTYQLPEESHVENPKLCHKCKECGKGFDRPSKLRHHFDKRHLNPQPAKPIIRKKRVSVPPSVCVCDVCGRDFKNMTGLKRHHRTHANDGDDPHTEKEAKKSPVCKICGKQFSQMAYYRFHMKIHSGEKNYTCDECSASFVHYFSLIYHKRKHSGERNFKCDQCSKEYFTSDNLKMHIKREHLNERPYKCDLCDYTSINKSHLKRHITSHTDEKPFNCNTCEKAFKDNASLKRHMKSHLRSTIVNGMHEPLPLGNVEKL